MGLRKKKTFIDQASDYVEAVRPQLESAVDAAREAAKDAREKAAPYVADARAKAAPALADARAKAAPVLAAGAAVAAEKASTGASLAAEKAAAGRDLAASKVARLKGEPEPQKGSKLKKIVLIGALAGVLGFVAKKLRGDSSDNWQSSYVPSPAPTPPTTSTPTPPATPAAPAADADDTGGSSPDEALADSAESPHDATTPDQPAEVISIDDAPGGEHRA